MNDEELKKKCKEREKIFQQAMESCHSSSPIDCIEWFADRIAELEAEVKERKDKADLWCKTANLKDHNIMINKELEKENAELKETLRTYNGCGDWDDDFHTCRVYLQHEELQEYIEQLTKAKEIIKELVRVEYADFTNGDYSNELSKVLEQAEQFLKEVEK